MRKLVVGVMGPGESADQETMATARTLGKLVAEEGWVVLSGGRDVGVMKAVNEGAKEVAGSLTIGILPRADSQVSPHVDVVIVTEMHNARNNINVLSSDVVIACGAGGPGTVSEVALALKAGKFVLLIRTDALTNAFFQRLAASKVLIVQEPEEAIVAIKQLYYVKRDT